MFQLTTTRPAFDHTTGEWVVGDVEVETFTTFAELKREAMHVHGIPAKAFNSTTGTHAERTTYCFQGWRWAWAEVVAEQTETPAPLAALADALVKDAAEIAQTLGVTLPTVRRWIAGVQAPNSRNRAALAELVTRAHREHSAAGNRWSARRDAMLGDVKLTLMTRQERATWTANRDQMRAQFAATA